MAGIDLQCSVIASKSLLVPPQLPQRNGLVIPGVALFRVNFQGLIEALECLRIATQGLERGTLVAQGISVSRIGLQRLVIVTDC